MDFIGCNFGELDSLKGILDLLPKYKLYKFVENWYLKRKELLQEINELNP
jgi:plasmid replication initiation protein